MSEPLFSEALRKKKVIKISKKFNLNKEDEEWLDSHSIWKLIDLERKISKWDMLLQESHEEACHKKKALEALVRTTVSNRDSVPEKNLEHLEHQLEKKQKDLLILKKKMSSIETHLFHQEERIIAAKRKLDTLDAAIKEEEELMNLQKRKCGTNNSDE